MKGSISIITLLVDDLQRSVSFYRDGLGLPMRSADDSSAIAFFPLNGAWLSLYPREKFAETEGVGEAGTREDLPRCTIAHNVATEKEVSEVINLARSAGARIRKEPQKVFWGGYSGYFEDPDGHLWEVAHNPFFDTP
ncbi:MAG: VOC family protein [Candidatus Kaiserbacteria bacterium]|nr:VOC family protein [Candidatus Kaiserbacteria bacterium]